MKLRNSIELTVFLNGKFVRASEARISVFDHGFLFGDGLFEEMRTCDGGICGFVEHFHRLSANAKALGITLPMGCRAMYKTIKILLQQNYLDNGHVRIVLSRGEGAPYLDPSLVPESTFCILVNDDAFHSDALSETGVAAVTLDEERFPRRVLMPQMSHCSMLDKVIAFREMKERGGYEGLYFSRERFVSEGIRSNVFAVKGKQILTPDLQCGISDRISRGMVMRLAQSLKIDISETLLNLEDLASCDECFVTNAVWGILPVIRIDEAPVGDGRVGQTTKYLKRQYRKFIISDILNTEKMLE